MAFNKFFIALGRLGNYLGKITRNKSTLPPAIYKTSLDTSPLSKSLSLSCKYIKRVANQVNWQPSSRLAYMQVSNREGGGTAMYLVFLALQKHHFHLDFKFLDRNNNAIIAMTFNLQLLNKDYEYIRTKL